MPSEPSEKLDWRWWYKFDVLNVLPRKPHRNSLNRFSFASPAGILESIAWRDTPVSSNGSSVFAVFAAATICHLQLRLRYHRPPWALCSGFSCNWNATGLELLPCHPFLRSKPGWRGLRRWLPPGDHRSKCLDISFGGRSGVNRSNLEIRTCGRRWDWVTWSLFCAECLLLKSVMNVSFQSKDLPVGGLQKSNQCNWSLWWRVNQPHHEKIDFLC
jgi:hypothetical protein